MIRTVSDWRAALPALKRRGREWRGPCPACGGRDRFHIQPGAAGGGALVGCRGCIDGLEPGARARRYGEIVRAVWPDEGDGFERPRTRPRDRVPSPSPDPATGPDARRGAATTSTDAGRCWDAAAAADGTPAAAYLAGRLCWPPGAALPASIRWLSLARWPASTPRPDAGAGAAGAIVFAFRKAGALAAVQADALTGAGALARPRPHNWRRTIGPGAGAVFEAAHPRAGTPARPRPNEPDTVSGESRLAFPRFPGAEKTPTVGGISLAEGPLSALASMWEHGAARALATGGTAGLAGFDAADLAGLAGFRGRLIVEADGDVGGRRAALACADRLRAAGFDAATVHRAAGFDAVDEWAAELEERAAILEFGAGLPRAEADRAAWRALGGLE